MAGRNKDKVQRRRDGSPSARLPGQLGSVSKTMQKFDDAGEDANCPVRA